MKHLKKLAVITVCTVLSATAFAVSTKSDSSAGFSVINLSGASVITNSVGNCGIQFPTPVSNDDSQSIVTSSDSSYPCYAVYNNGCVVKMSEGDNGLVTMTSSSENGACTQADATSVEMTSSS